MTYPITPDERQQIVQYATDSRRVTYEADSAPTGQTRRLTHRRIAGKDTVFVLGPTVHAAPVTCSHRYTRQDIQQGVLAARLVADSAYNKLNLPAGTSYVWIYSYDPRSASALAAIIPENPAEPMRVDSVQVNLHQGFTHGFAQARWEFAPEDDYLWESCVLTGCCRVYGRE